MKYIKNILWDDIKSKYEHVIAWGTGPLFSVNFRKDFINIECIIDGTGKNVGTTYDGHKVESVDYIKKIEQNTLIIIYTIYEKQVLEQINKIDNSYIDVVLFSLLDFKTINGESIPKINAKHAEDILLIQLFRELGIVAPRYLEIGVCHPIVRNNTFLIHQLYCDKENYMGVLVEANPLCWDLIEEYRNQDILVKGGAARENNQLDFYAFPDYLGHSTFIKELAEKKSKRGFYYTTYNIPVYNINQILKDYCDNELDLIAIDAEGLDEEIITSIDFDMNRISIILFESSYTESNLYSHLETAGYMLIARTYDNEIWVKKDRYVKI